MANRYSIETTFRLIDNFSKPLSKLGVASSGATSVLNKQLVKAEERWNSLGRAVKTSGKIIAAAGIAMAGAFIGKSLKEFTEFDEALHGAGAAFSDLSNLDTEDFEKKLNEIGVVGRTVAASTEFNMLQAANGLKTFAQAGVESSLAVKGLSAVADFATAAGVDLEQGTGYMLNSLNSLNMFSTEEKTLTTNMKRLSDMMAYTANSAKMTVIDVAEAVKIGGSGFTKTNQSIDDMSAAITALAARGYAGAEAGNALKNIMTKLSAPVTKAQKSLDTLGIDTRDSDGNLMNFIDLIEQFENATKGMGDAEIAEHLKNIFGLENINQFNAILASGSEKLREFSATSASSAGAVEQMAGRIRMSLGNQIKILQSELTELGAKFSQAIINNGGSETVAKLTEVIHNFDPTPLISAMVVVIDKLPGIIDGIVSLVSTIWKLRGVIIGIGATVLAFKGIMMGVVAVMNAWKAIQTVITVVTTAYTIATSSSAAATAALGFMTKGAAAATSILAGVMKAMNFLFVSSPIGWIILGIGALIAIIILLVKHWDVVKQKMTEVGQKIAEVASVVWNALVTGIEKAVEWIGNMSQQFGFLLGPLGLVVSAITEVVKSFDLIKAAFSEGGILNGIRAIGTAILSGLLAPIQHLLEMLSRIPGMGKLAGSGAAALDSLRNNLMGSVTQAPVTQAPTTQGERVAYSREESYNTVDVNLNMPKGVTGTVSGKAPGIDIHTVKSGSF